MTYKRAQMTIQKGELMLPHQKNGASALLPLWNARHKLSQ
jgi:hypothetical protein